MTLTFFQLIILISFIAIVLPALFTGFLILGVSVYRYGQNEAFNIEDLIMGESIIAEEMTEEEFEQFILGATDHPELWIDGKKIDKKEAGLIYIDFSKTSLKVEPNEDDEGGEKV